MRLRALFRQLDPNAISDVNALISSFEQAGIKTVPDFLYSLPPAVLYDRLPPGTIPYANFLSLQRQTAQLTAATPLTGNELLEEQKIKRAGMAGGSLGVEQLDSLLGGLGLLHVVEVVGGHSSGKTALALQVVCRHLARHPESSALWLDTTSSFSAARAQNMVHQLGGDAAETALDRLHVSSCFDAQGAFNILEDLRESFKASSSPPFRFLVIDSVTELFAPALNSTQGHAAMVTFMRGLRSFAESYSVTILMTNVAVATRAPSTTSALAPLTSKPALGPTCSFMSDATIRLSKSQGSNLHHVLEVSKVRDKPSGTWCAFAIREGILTETV